jgi:hypothetical protein
MWTELSVWAVIRQLDLVLVNSGRLLWICPLQSLGSLVFIRASTGQTDLLLVGKSFHRGYPRRAVRRQQTGDERNHTGDNSGTGKARDVKRWHLEEEHPHGLASQPCSKDPQYRASREQP